MLHDIVNFVVDTVGSLGYTGIFIMMFLESSFFPFPSEVVMVPAGYLAYKGEMNIYFAIFAGVAGSLTGALFNYFLAVKFGRAFLVKYGKYFFIKEETISKMEEFFKSHGHISTFSGRLIPAVRQYISFPAGLARMNLLTFSIYTTLGAAIWVVILTLLGYYLGDNEALIKEYLRYIIVGILICLAIIGFWYYSKIKKNNKNS
ncbi:DedA family protein [Poseidonibacter ostreae]|jgi:membrane protein DedA with SNARE-associated domain|uniref:DedA family protein n=1 Tax=Poseidonibacter ostreae TaxID=2654171 RepID=A0A6L4WXQ4_9BACT|nr:DedA family protein [Poseidonibacter ostreae]KAB7887970.1 DedA family protein [Poseidonibacter ostreae]KAB7891111.1 DedA family protein [Poseidonibacter ostreae]KAB7892835.1 DedA family protein [Poseidonibacter ostreae]|tara:strand:+ start:616 stop:1224 length:609 start_codon:yes stop_codon:yes gene_type:complete